MEARGLEVTPEALATQAAENAANGSGAGGGGGSEREDEESDNDTYDDSDEDGEEGSRNGRGNGGPGAALDSDEEDARDQAEAKANDPEYQAILSELARVAAVIEGSEGARPVVTPSQPSIGGLSTQEKEMIEAAKEKQKDKDKDEEAIATTATTTASEGGGDQTEVVVPLHLRHDHDGPLSSLPHIYGHGTVIENDAVNPGGINSGGIDGYDNPGNLFVRTPSGTPKYAGKEGKPKTPLNSTVKLVASNEIRPTNRANVLDAQEELLRSEM